MSKKILEFTPLTELTQDDINYLHIHATLDGLKRSCNLTNNVTRVLHDNDEYSKVPTIYYEKVRNIDTQKLDETTVSVDLHPSLRNEDGSGWVMHVLVSDYVRFNSLEITSGGGGGGSQDLITIHPQDISGSGQAFNTEEELVEFLGVTEEEFNKLKNGEVLMVKLEYSDAEVTLNLVSTLGTLHTPTKWLNIIISVIETPVTINWGYTGSSYIFNVLPIVQP